MRILVISDTHIPRSAQDLPEAIYKEIENVDMIVHAGDFVEKELFDKFKSLKRDQGGLREYGFERDYAACPESKEVFEVGKFKIGLIHGYGAPANLLETVKSEFKDVDAIIFGHSHAAAEYGKGRDTIL